ncbi:MAG: PQQ-binding-like beta-propeller repeat protein [Steroidobacteraceae bacterium]
MIGALFLLGIALAPMASAAPHRQRAETPFSFTRTQAELGRVTYADRCARCHGQNLSGGEFAGPLNGERFSQDWSGKTVAALFTYVRTRMPPQKPGSLTSHTAAGLVAYLLEVNGTAPGHESLPADPLRLAALTVPYGPIAPSPPFMPLSPLAPSVPLVVLANPLNHFTPVTEAMLRRPPASEWLLWRRTYDDHGFSPLAAINRRNVGRLRVAWTWSLPRGPNETTPLEHDGVLFVGSFGDDVQAIDAATGNLLWQYSRRLPSDARLAVKRNLAIYRDTLLVPTSDDHVVALDARTGTVRWDTAVADYKKSWQVTGGPLVARGVVMQGITGQSPGGAWIQALDFKTGRPLWRFYTIARPGKPGGESWNGLPLDKRSGASVWTAGSFDPQLGLAFFGVAQTYDTGPLVHPIHEPGISSAGLYTDSTLAIDPQTGKLAWYFQHVPNDQWDLDWAFEQQVIHLPVRGVRRKLIVTSGKMALIEGMDAATGKFAFSKDLGIQNVVASVDPRTGAPTLNPEVEVGDGKPHTICPHPGGGRNWIATSYDAGTKMLYVPMVESCMDLIPAPKGQRGDLTSGYDWYIRPRPDSDGKYGRVEAVNLETRKVAWIDRQRAPETTCTLATAGGVVFAGSLDRYLDAYDAASGKPLWRVRLDDVPGACPISYSVDGRQYLAIVVSAGGSEAGTFKVLVPEIENPPSPGATLWVFALPQRLGASGPLSAASPGARTPPAARTAPRSP